jgi:large subunit ribosomal protein L30
MAESKSNKKIAIILIRGLIGMSGDAKLTAKLLKLFKKHSCIIVDNNSVMMGMARKLKDYTTYGEINDETYKLLVEKRGKKDKDGKLKNIFNLSPPVKGFERKGTKKSFVVGGALGYRKEKINDLIKRMI